MPVVRNIELPPLPIGLPELLAEIEAAYINEALLKTAGERKGAAALLGFKRTALVEKLRRRGQTTRRNTGHTSRRTT